MFEYDSGLNWDQLSSINSLKIFNMGDSLSNETMFYNHNFFYSNAKYHYDSNFLITKNNFFIYLNPIISFKSNQVEIKLIDNSGFGFHNNWVTIGMCKGREKWGAGSSILLTLSEHSRPYDYFFLTSNYGNVRVNYIHGFLETIYPDINRFINARGLEWTNKKSILISISETIIYSGNNRNIEMGYLNPISSHLEIELNNRLTQIGDFGANAVWQFHFDYLSKNKSRVSFNYLFDEFVLDPDIQIGKEHGKAYSLKWVFPVFNYNKSKLNMFLSKLYIGTPTFRHGIGTNNFVNRDTPLGWEYGSDGKESKIGFNYHINNKSIFSFSFKAIEIGEETITKRPYEPYKDYLKGKFPSGEVLNFFALEGDLNIKMSSNFYLLCDTHFKLEDNYIKDLYLLFGITFCL